MILIAPKLLTMHHDAPPINNGAVVVNRSAILAVGPANKILKKYPEHRVYRLENAVLLPGLINLHTHLELPPLLDAIRAKTFPDWVINLVRAKKDLGNQAYLRATRENIDALIRSGTTTVGEICTHGVSPARLKQSGLRAAIFHEIISMNLERPFTHPSSLVPRPSSLMHHGISPHTPFTVSESALRAIVQFTQKKNVRIAMHIAESKNELRLLQGKKSGLLNLYRLAGWDPAWAPSASSSFEYLQRIGVLSPELLAIHAVQVTNKDIALIKKSNVSVAHCPRSNKETGVGRMPLKKFLDAEIPVGLGTDSLASVPSLNLWDEMRYAYRTHRRDGITPNDIFILATMGGARALGMEAELGSLEPGKKADIIAASLPDKNTGDLYSDLLRETKSCIMTMVNGKILRQKSSNFKIQISNQKPKINIKED